MLSDSPMITHLMNLKWKFDLGPKFQIYKYFLKNNSSFCLKYSLISLGYYSGAEPNLLIHILPVKRLDPV